MKHLGLLTAAAICALSCAPEDGADPDTHAHGDGGQDAPLDVAVDTARDATSEEAAAPNYWQPGQVRSTPGRAGPRGLLDLRGLVHAHSVYSHDACDGEPRENEIGAINAPCLASFRAALCNVEHDYAMLTDHNTSFGDAEFPDVLLYDAALGDELVTRGGGPVANRLACADGTSRMILAGTESGAMPVGLERHVASDSATRHDEYDDISEPALAKFRAQGAVVLVAHTENWTPDQLVSMSLDGFEMYNLHANLFRGAGYALTLIAQLPTPELLPHPDLCLLPVMSEDARYLDTWSTVLARGVKRVTTLGTDCHENTFPQLMPDGERVDSYRRMMQWFSNHLLVTPASDGTWTDANLKDALRGGRLYGVFEVLGYARGFDFHATSGGTSHEMGDEVALDTAPHLVAHLPTVVDLDPGVTPPDVRIRLLRASESGWETLSESASDLDYTVSATGAYRVEVRMKPHHLVPFLGSYTAQADRDFPWVYSNPIYVR